MQTRIRIAFSFLLILSLSGNSFGQLASIGFSFGPTYSAPIIKNTSGLPNSYRYHTYSDVVLSVFGQYNVRKNFGVLFDFGISGRGSSFSQPVTLASYDLYDTTITYSYKKNQYENAFTYLDNAVLAKYTKGNKVKVYGTAGLYYSILLRARKFIVDEYYDSYGGADPTRTHAKFTDNLRVQYKKSDLGFAVGLGVEYGRFALDYRYSIGLLNIYKSPETAKIHTSFSTVKLMITLRRIKKDYFKDPSPPQQQ
jgi:hypothetical protein